MLRIQMALWDCGLTLVSGDIMGKSWQIIEY